MMNFKQYTIKDLAEVFSGYAFSTIEMESNGVPILKIGNIQNHQITKETDSFYSNLISSKLSKYILQRGDFLIAMTGAGSVGKSGKMVDFETPFLINQRVAIVRANPEKVDPVFLFYFYSLDYIERFLYGLGIGAGQPNISANDISGIKALFPSLRAQQQIASILSAYDSLMENNNKRIKILEQMAENLYKEWFVRFRFPGHETTPLENGIPKGWKIEKIKNCAKRLPFGKTYKETELEKEGAVIVIDQSTEPFIGYHNDVAAHQASANNPIILFGDHSCKFVLMTRDFSLGENIVPFISYNDEIVNPYYLFFATHKIIETTEYKRHWGEFVNKKILIPSIDLQKEFARMSIPLKLQLEQLLIENQNLIKQRDLLLPRLMSGKLAV